VLARISKVAVQNNFVGMAQFFVGVITCFWAWLQFFVVVELWCSIRRTFLLLVLNAHFRH
jgi:hypothetical protein